MAGRLLSDLEPAERVASWHLVEPSGNRRSAGDALAPLLAMLPGGRLPSAVLGRVPALTDRGYRLIAEHRAALSSLVPAGAKNRAAMSIEARRGPRSGMLPRHDDIKEAPMTDMTPGTNGDGVAPIARAAGEGEALWAFGGLATIKASSEATGGRVAVIEQLAPRGSGSPLHVHHNEDEWFYVIEGELTFWVGGQVITAPAGSFVYGPRDVPHTFIVSSDEARFLLVAEPGAFDGFLRANAEPARELVIPPPATEPPDMEALMASAAAHGIEILGPPGIPD